MDDERLVKLQGQVNPTNRDHLGDFLNDVMKVGLRSPKTSIGDEL